MPHHPNSKFRVRVTPAKRGRGRKRRQPTGESWIDKTPAECHQPMTWMQRLKRVFNWAAFGSIRRRPHRDLRAVRGAGQDHRRGVGPLHRRASVAPAKRRTVGLIERILSHRKDKEPSAELAMLPEERAPPQVRLGVPD